MKSNQTISNADPKRRWRDYLDACDRVAEANRAAQHRWQCNARGLRPEPLPLPPLPDDLRRLTCGARNRRGEPCKRSDIYRNGRCKYHGGLSTGPKTAEGKGRARGNLGLRWLPEPYAGLREPDAAAADLVLANVSLGGSLK